MARRSPRITLIVARARNGVIGRDNALPWHLPEDLRHFKATTMGHTLVMGRKTFDSIGRPLPGRRTIVLSRNQAWSHPGCERAESIEAALSLVPDADEVFVVGGDEVYRNALTHADRAIVTELEIEPEGDAFFPALDNREWEEVSRSTHRSAGGIEYSIVHYARRS
jgi:dihydrofolate reductase